MDSIPIIYQCQNILQAMILQTLKHLILCVHRPTEVTSLDIFKQA